MFLGQCTWVSARHRVPSICSWTNVCWWDTPVWSTWILLESRASQQSPFKQRQVSDAVHREWNFKCHPCFVATFYTRARLTEIHPHAENHQHFLNWTINIWSCELFRMFSNSHIKLYVYRNMSKSSMKMGSICYKISQRLPDFYLSLSNAIFFPLRSSTCLIAGGVTADGRRSWCLVCFTLGLICIAARDACC